MLRNRLPGEIIGPLLLGLGWFWLVGCLGFWALLYFQLQSFRLPTMTFVFSGLGGAVACFALSAWLRNLAGIRRALEHRLSKSASNHYAATESQ